MQSLTSLHKNQQTGGSMTKIKTASEVRATAEYKYITKNFSEFLHHEAAFGIGQAVEMSMIDFASNGKSLLMNCLLELNNKLEKPILTTEFLLEGLESIAEDKKPLLLQAMIANGYVTDLTDSEEAMETSSSDGSMSPDSSIEETTETELMNFSDFTNELGGLSGLGDLEAF